MEEKDLYFTVNAVNMFHGIKPFKIPLPVTELHGITLKALLIVCGTFPLKLSFIKNSISLLLKNFKSSFSSTIITGFESNPSVR